MGVASERARPGVPFDRAHGPYVDGTYTDQTFSLRRAHTVTTAGTVVYACNELTR
jgi:hypothetical protein